VHRAAIAHPGRESDWAAVRPSSPNVDMHGVRRSTLTRAARCSRSGPAQPRPTRLACPQHPDRPRPRPRARARPGPRRPAEQGRRPWLCIPLPRHEPLAGSAHAGILRWRLPSGILWRPIQGRLPQASARHTAATTGGQGTGQPAARAVLSGVQVTAATCKDVFGGDVGMFKEGHRLESPDQRATTGTATHSATCRRHSA